MIFYIPSLNLLLEVDGEYWHSKSLEQINKDNLKQNTAKKQGFNFLRISDHDWKPELIWLDGDKQFEYSKKLVEERKINFLKKAA